jgi:hypothetical protein
MSMVSHAAGSRFISLIGGAMTSFYDWYADLPVASPQEFGDETDVPESGDWWDASYLAMWGSNVPITRTPDAHWMAEARYRGAKVVVVSPDYADNTKFADEWMRCAAGTDAALAMAMGHVILSECYVRKQVPFFVDYVRRYTDLPFLIKLERRGDALVPGKFLTAADIGEEVENSAFKPALLDEVTGRVVVPHGSLGFRYGGDGVGKWNLDLGPVIPALRAERRVIPRRQGRRGRRAGGSAQLRHGRRPRRDGVAGCAGAPGRRAGGVHGVRPDAGAVCGGAPGIARRLAHGLRRPGSPEHPCLAGTDHGGACRAGHPRRQGIRPQCRGIRRAIDGHHGRRHLPLVPRRRHLPLGAGAADDDRLDGSQRRGMGPLCRSGEGAPAVRVANDGQRHRLGAPAATGARRLVLVCAHRPVALRRLRGGQAGQPGGTRQVHRTRSSSSSKTPSSSICRGSASIA